MGRCIYVVLRRPDLVWCCGDEREALAGRKRCVWLRRGSRRGSHDRPPAAALSAPEATCGRGAVHARQEGSPAASDPVGRRGFDARGPLTRRAGSGSLPAVAVMRASRRAGGRGCACGGSLRSRCRMHKGAPSRSTLPAGWRQRTACRCWSLSTRAMFLAGARSLKAATGAHAQRTCLGRRMSQLDVRSAGSGPSARTSAAERAQRRHKRSGAIKRKS